MSIYSAAGRAALVPRPSLSVSEWADRYRMIPSGTSPEAGCWRTSRAPYLREPMDAISDPSVEIVIGVFSSQAGKTEGFVLNPIGYFAHQDPSSILLVGPNEGVLMSFAKERLGPMFEQSPALRGLFSSSLRDKDNTIALKKFPGGYLATAWSTSAATLASRPIRILIGDEIDRWEESTGKDGDPLIQAIQRTRNFTATRKIILVSSPTDDTSSILRLYDDTDQRHLHVPCLKCGAFQVLAWSGIVYKRDNVIHLDGTHYVCAHCSQEIQERERPEMLEACQWVADNPDYQHDPDRQRRGYQLSALYSPWVKWRSLAAEWTKVWAERDKHGQKEFVNLQLAERWTVAGGKGIAPEALDKNCEDYGAEVPPGVLILTAGVDTQDNRLECEVVGWGEGKESWGIQYFILPGNTLDLGPKGPWARLDEILQRNWTRADGTKFALWAVCIDSRGHRTDEVYEFCRLRHGRNIFAIYGVEGEDKPIAGKPTLTKFRSPKYPIGVDKAKNDTYSRLELPEPGPGYCHFPVDVPLAPPRGYDREFFRGLTSERKQPKGPRGALVWVQKYARNEPLDCRNYATAAMELLNPDFAALAAAAAAPVPPTTQPAKRRVHSQGVGW